MSKGKEKRERVLAARIGTPSQHFKKILRENNNKFNLENRLLLNICESEIEHEIHELGKIIW